MNQWIFAVICASFVAVSRQEELEDCVAGEYFDSSSRVCKNCRERTYSEDAASTGKCERCPDNKLCFCDTSRIEVYAPARKEAPSFKNCSKNGTLQCSFDCYTAATRAQVHPRQGSLQKLASILSCKCENPKTKESCEEAKEFAQHCFQNECDGGKHYLDGELEQMLYSFAEDHSANKSYNEDLCGALRPHFGNLTTCNCFHHHGYYVQVKIKKRCKDLKKFYVDMEKACKVNKSKISWFVAPATVVLLFFALIALGQYSAVKYGRHLKESGEIEKITPYIEWDEVLALGMAGCAVRSERTAANVLSNKEIILKVRFGLLKGCFGRRFVKPQHVVLKIFSESQCEQQGVELGVINSIFNKSLARDSNIISVYGPARGSSNRGLVTFLEQLIAKSESCKKLADVIERCYLGATEDRLLAPPRCRYIMMNHCNELSLSKFMSNNKYFSLKTVLHICSDIAKALDFLHERNRREDQHTMIIHCDIKPDNIFVKKRRKTSFIVGDFGLSVALSPGEVFRLKGSTPSFLPPEWFVEMKSGGNYSQIQKDNIESRGCYPSKIDIYQYGLIIWIVTHMKSDPWEDELKKAESHFVNSKFKKHEFLKRLFSEPESFSTRPSFAVDANPVLAKLSALAKSCWQPHIIERPSASEIISILALDNKTGSYV